MSGACWPPRPRGFAAPILRAYAAHEPKALPASGETIALYLAALAWTHKPVTMTWHLTSFIKAHQANGLASAATGGELVVGVSEPR